MENSRALHDELKHIVGESGILPEAQVAAYAFDGYVPKAVVLPASVQDMQDVLQFAAKEDLSVVPAGAGTKLGIGNLPEKVDIVLATTRLNSVVEYEPADLTVTVEAGIRLADLQAELAQHRQYLPLDPPAADRCTLGGDCRNECEWIAPYAIRGCSESGLRVTRRSREWDCRQKRR